MAKFWGKFLSSCGAYGDQNQDTWIVDEKIGFVVVCDGMGGHVAGDRASSIAANNLHDELSLRLAESRGLSVDIRLLLREAALKAAHDVFDASMENIELRGMGTTLTAIVFDQQWAHFAHIGDSRAYCFRNGQLSCLTEDHTYEKYLQNKLGEDSRFVKIPKLRNILTRSIGSKRDPEFDFFSIEVLGNDLFLLCSDGLNSGVDDALLESIVEIEPNEMIPECLADLARKGGAIDDVTVGICSYI